MPRNAGEDERPGLPVRIAPGGTHCRFCPEAAAVVRSPDELVAVAVDAYGDGVRRLLLSAAAPAEYARAVRARVPALRVSVHCHPDDTLTLSALAASGVTDVDIHVGSLDDDVRARGSAGGTTLPLAGYERAWDEGVRVFGPYRVSTCLAVGAGENPGELVAGAARLIARGVQPVVVPYQAGTDALVRWIGQAVTDMLRTVGAAGPATAAGTPPAVTTTGWGMG